MQMSCCLTEVLHLDGGHPADVPLDEEVQVGEDDEGRGQAGPRVVLHYQIVPLELPVSVTVLLYFVEGVAVQSHIHTSVNNVTHSKHIIHFVVFVL